MPFCKYCHKEIEKYDSDMCPFCGERHPIDENYQTMDITRPMAILDETIDMPKAKSQKVAALLCAFLGYLGVHDFYIYRPGRGVIELLITLALVGGVGCLLFFTCLPNALAFLIPFACVWLFYIVKGILFGKFDSPKDGHGDFLR